MYSRLGQWTPPLVPESDGEWWEGPLEEVSTTASEWLSEQVNPNTSPWGPGIYAGRIEGPDTVTAPVPVDAEPAPMEAGAGVVALLAVGALAFAAGRR